MKKLLIVIGILLIAILAISKEKPVKHHDGITGASNIENHFHESRIRLESWMAVTFDLDGVKTYIDLLVDELEYEMFGVSEDPLKIEPWMLTSFDKECEPEQPVYLESWMSKPFNTEEELLVESWMTKPFGG